MPLVFIYTISGTALFIYLFVKFLRRGQGDATRHKLDIFHQNMAVNRKLRKDFSYFLAFVGLLAGLFIFVATVAWLFHIVEAQK